MKSNATPAISEGEAKIEKRGNQIIMLIFDKHDPGSYFQLVMTKSEAMTLESQLSRAIS